MRTGTDIEALIAKAQTTRLLYQALAAKAYDYLLKYSPDQPRVPRGNSGGGQWMSENGVNFVKRFELFKPSPYGDEGDKLTIGYGHLITPQDSFPSAISEEEARRILQRDLQTAENTVKRYVTVPLKQHQFDALVSLTYNNGPKVFRQETYPKSGIYKNTTLLNLLNSRDYNGAANQMLKFNKVTHSDGTVSYSRGLARRREKERDIFLHGIYKTK